MLAFPQQRHIVEGPHTPAHVITINEGEQKDLRREFKYPTTNVLLGWTAKAIVIFLLFATVRKGKNSNLQMGRRLNPGDG